MELPKSLTAIVHMRFHYEPPPTRPLSEAALETLNSLMDRAAELDADAQEILAKFAEYIKQSQPAGSRQSPD